MGLLATEVEASTLSHGDVNDDVIELQEELQSLGMYDYNIDGIFGDITKAGVKEYQELNGANVDGIVGAETLSYLEFDLTSEEVVQTASVEAIEGHTMTVEATAYTAFCSTGCIGVTANGTDVSSTIYHPTGHRVIATDPAVIPTGTIVNINGETFIADDTGGNINGNRIDILVNSKQEAFQFGRQNIDITVLD